MGVVCHLYVVAEPDLAFAKLFTRNIPGTSDRDGLRRLQIRELQTLLVVGDEVVMHVKEEPGHRS